MSINNVNFFSNFPKFWSLFKINKKLIDLRQFLLIYIYIYISYLECNSALNASSFD